MRQLIVEGTVGISQSLNQQETAALLGNPENKTVIYATKDISNADIINQALQNTENLCKGKIRLTNTILPASTEEVLCFQNTDLSIDLTADANEYENKTIIMRNGNIILSETMSSSSAPIELFIDQGNLYLNNTMTSMQNFDAQGYTDDAGITNA